MGASVFSILSAVVWFNVAVLLVVLLRPRSAFLMRHGASVLFALFLLGALRVLFPLDLPFSYVIESRYVLPAIRSVLSVELVPDLGHLTVGMALVFAWLIGGAVTLLRIVRRLMRERAARAVFHVAASPQVERVLKKMNARHVTVSVVSELAIPVVIGIFHAHIYLPELALTDDELELVLTHELRHFRSRDTLTKLFYLVLRVVFWWNPLISSFQKELDRVLELKCDAGVTKAFDKDQKMAYLSSIVSVIKQVPTPAEETFVGASALIDAHSHSFLRQRFQLVLAETPKRGKQPLLFLSVLAAAFLLSFLVIVQPVSQPPEVEAGFTLSPDNAYILVDGEALKLYVDGTYCWEVMDERFDEPFCSLPILAGGDLQ